ncbi:DNA-binding response regulator [Streptomyces europaeiscabiei]|uniref:Response regulator transcription factor n=1 Tax=Streptomyces europaeiscabiei TaxID=146819 RepID=A0ABU4NF05_9ACTN|nr:response regulator transcription factor [Streptomyces europaeiscabiei]MDX2529766.1 response regulator transcription factor [Streptomyces europaeiscabiei]MDX2766687.1 response regulator transcription factor [Streptomyces europaeiscabiei]MDX3544186.1 response regulator transcription factor [Streptomyces europaeiscabiei]MDX3552420.1 response regulator transcription factor [Streptomyces europaeiscabiei]MDX3665548.1 response regulator transcription factor [Streptomyces europaeiscabiei]
MPQHMALKGDLELHARIKPLVELYGAEWVSAARDLDTWPNARDSARLRIRRDGTRQARKLYSPAVLADERDREVLREMAAHGIQVRISATPLPQGTVFIDRRTMFLTDPDAAPSSAHGPRRRTYTMSAEPALVSGAYALFEAAWETATDLAALSDADRPRIDAQAREVLYALGSGMTDVAAARELGMSLRTYRRRVAELLVALGADSRFQAGMRAGELGLTRG